MAPQESRFARFIASHSTNGAPLPLVHTIPAFKFAELCQLDSLEPFPCPHFKRNLVYLFYGRPAYRTEGAEFSDLTFNWPITLIIDPTKIEEIVSVFPFDTGAFFFQLYSRYLSKSQKVEDFTLPPNLESAQKIVSAFYRNPKEYMLGRSTKNVEIPPFNFEAEGIHKLAREPSFTQRISQEQITRDERSSSIEVQVGRRIPIEDAIIQIILPQEFLYYEPVVTALERWKVNASQIKYYEVFSNDGVQGITSQIYSIVIETYRKLGIIE